MTLVLKKLNKTNHTCQINNLKCHYTIKTTKIHKTLSIESRDFDIHLIGKFNKSIKNLIEFQDEDFFHYLLKEINQKVKEDYLEKILEENNNIENNKNQKTHIYENFIPKDKREKINAFIVEEVLNQFKDIRDKIFEIRSVKNKNNEEILEILKEEKEADILSFIDKAKEEDSIKYITYHETKFKKDLQDFFKRFENKSEEFQTYLCIEEFFGKIEILCQICEQNYKTKPRIIFSTPYPQTEILAKITNKNFICPEEKDEIFQ